MTKLSATEKAKRAKARQEARGEKFRRKQWAKKYGPQLFDALEGTRVLLGHKAWRGSAPERIQKARPLIAQLYRALGLR